MNTLIYDIRLDGNLQRLLNERRFYFPDEFYIEEYGVYGTNDWWSELEKIGLLTVYEGSMVETSGNESTKLDFPEFVVNIDGENFCYECKGDKSAYVVGCFLALTLVRKKSDGVLLFLLIKSG